SATAQYQWRHRLQRPQCHCPLFMPCGYDDTINAQSTIKLFQQIELQNPGAARIHIICDNARYYHAQLVNSKRLATNSLPD
ncbi:MAG: hypothetical protein Q8S55_19805, partial [Methylococcaceae bacterium]|nr:hypothetical protein [Methylococcaceae bacterium]